MHKYKMNNEQDYRIGNGVNPHGVLLIKRVNGEDWAYGSFKTIDADMVELTQEEITSNELVETNEVPQTITKLQAMKQLKAIDKWNTLKAILASDEDVNDEWVLSDNLNRIYPLVLGMAQALNISDAELDTLFIEASKL